MAEAVKQLFPEARFGIGPAIENGFYYDFDLPRSLTPEDLAVIEAKMKEIIQADLPFQYREVSPEEARRIFADQPYKLELIEGILAGREGADAKLPHGLPPSFPSIPRAPSPTCAVGPMWNAPAR